jgi:hypothetical protein
MEPLNPFYVVASCSIMQPVERTPRPQRQTRGGGQFWLGIERASLIAMLSAHGDAQDQDHLKQCARAGAIAQKGIVKSSTDAARASLKTTVVPKAKRGAKEKFNWHAVEKKVEELMEYHGDFSLDDRNWSRPVDLRNAILKACFERRREPSESRLDDQLRQFVAKWRKRKTL